MTGSTLENYRPLVEDIKREWGQRSNPIWLLVNPKHPTVRHNIWAPILAEVQDKVYREIHTRVDTAKVYIRNVVSDCRVVPNTLNWWDAEVATEIEAFRELILEHKPKIIISFGAFPYEFLRRVYEIKPEKGPKYWGNCYLGDEFVKAIDNFDSGKTNLFPLLRRVMASGKFIEDHDCIGENYFQYVGTRIAEKLIESKDSLNIWID